MLSIRLPTVYRNIAKSVRKLWFLRSSKIIHLLCDISEQSIENNGWVLLSTAGNIIKKQLPDELEHMKERYGHSSLKSLILASELFDVGEEKTPKGGKRVLFRLSDLGSTPDYS
ncbi:OST-HTH/LOTUS domain-containing protein [Parashewanella spongiae]|uniref:OST-HTH/LOTUS domain-containing protein n=1 Tax=Parashewanella spongiae TaxID=342950 RepID=UPI0014049F3B|nr:OST-HTH/LOTUS domain-containing protein [Parashewanella spongiae]